MKHPVEHWSAYAQSRIPKQGLFGVYGFGQFTEVYAEWFFPLLPLLMK